MSVIQTIRDRGALISAIVIAISLVGFILMDAFSGRGSIFDGERSTTLGTVNGLEIKYADFEAKLKAQEAQQQQQGYPMNESSRQGLVQQLWNQEVNRLVMQGEFEKLGLYVGKKELNDVLFNDPGEQVIQRFTDPQTGMYDAAAYQQQVMQWKNSKVPEDQKSFEQFLADLEYQRLNDKFNSLVAISAYYPKWYLEKQNAERSLLSNVSYVLVPYVTVSDSSVKISDKDISDYIAKNKDDFKVEESRSIEYVTFDAAPTAGDSAAVFQQLEQIKQSFATTTDNEGFINANYSELGYYKSKMAKSGIQAGPYIDSVVKVGAGNVYGPFVFGNNYQLAKVISQAVWPDTVNVRHILVSTMENGQQIRDDSSAKKLADSILGLVRRGSNFDSLVAQYSSDQGSKAKGGKYENVTPGGMVPAFNEYIFTHGPKSTDVVKTEFGYHVIEVLSQKGSSPVYEVAYLTKPIVASRETDASANNAANKFAGDSRDPKAFTANWEKELKAKGIQKVPVTLGPQDYNIMGLGVSRQFVRDVYEADQGDVLPPTMIGDKYVVAVVTAVTKEGTMSVEQARVRVEPLLRNEKKAQQIIQKIGSYTTLEEASTKAGFPIATADSLRFSGGSSQMSYETKFLGVSFNPANNGKVVTKPIDGSQGVYVVRVNSQTATSVASANIEDERRFLRQQAMQRIMGGYGNFGFGMQGATPASTLRNLAKIKDNRRKFNY